MDRRKLIVFLFCALFLSSIQALYAGTRKPLPKGIAVKPRALDFGKMLEGQTVRRTLTVQNNNDQAVEISRARSSCPCVDIKVMNSKIPAGKSTQVEVIVRSLTLHGKEEKSIYLSLTGAVKGGVLIKASMEVERVPAELTVTPRTLQCGTVWTDKTVVKELKIWNLGKDPLEIRSISSASRGIAGSLPGLGRIAPGESATVKVEILGGLLKPGPLAADLKLVTNNPFHYMIRIPVRGTVLEKKKDAKANE